jgi:hypothetical protein
LNGDAGPDESLVLAGELARVEAKIAELEAELLQGDVAALARVLRTLEGQKAEVAGRLAEARQKAAHPLSESWGEAQSLIGALTSAPDPQDARLRLRSALRRIVDSIFLLVVPRGRSRLALVQLYFTGKHEGRRRTYLVFHRPAIGNGKARTEPKTFVQAWSQEESDGIGLEGEVDLRDPVEAAKVAAGLAGLSQEELDGYSAAAETPLP